MHNKIPKGFTFIEMVIYIALLGLLMTGGLTVAADLIQSSGTTSGKATVQEEGGFVQRKLEWALAGTTLAPAIGGSGCSQTLNIARTGTPTSVYLQRNSTNNSVELKEGFGGTFNALTTSNVSVSCLKFAAIAAVGTGPAGITATATINGLDFVVTRYVRQ